MIPKRDAGLISATSFMDVHGRVTAEDAAPRGADMRDRDVRIAIRSQLEVAHAGDQGTRIVEEMGVWSGSVRVDLAVINGELSGFELKSAKDTLSRLPQQAMLYSQVFDKMTVVTAENHLEGCLELLPDWWGIMLAYDDDDGSVSVNGLRSAQPNPTQSAMQIARLLWKDEAVAILDRHGLSKGYRSKSVHVIHQRLADELPFDVLKSEIRSCLKARENWLQS